MFFHSESINRVYREVASSERGLTSKEAERRLLRDGDNVLSEGKKKGPLLLFLEQFKDFMTILLIIAAAISAVIAFLTKNRSEVVDTIILFFIILLNNVIGFIQQYRADVAIRKLKELSVGYTKVLRDGKTVEIDSRKLVVGDVVLFGEGDAVPADCRIIQAKNLLCNESALTGEAEQVEKSERTVGEGTPLAERKDMLYASTFITRGQARAVVVATGMAMEIGKIAHMIDVADTVPTPLERALDNLGKVISGAVVSIAVLLFLFGRFVQHVDILPGFMSSVAVAVAAIPEGLPAVVTVLMAFGVQRMSAGRAIIRKLKAVETLGGCDYICTDKTGTLTENRMSVEEVCSYGNLERIAACMHYCNSLHGGTSGDATEVALKRYTEEHEFSIPQGEKKDEIPFDSDRKMMSVCIRHATGSQVYVKGGIEAVLAKCTKFMEHGVARDLTGSDRRRILSESGATAEKALRVLAFACREGEVCEEKDLVFLGFCGLMDPPKQGTADAVKTCKEAGITMVMITGDQKDTALAIAKRLGIASSSAELMTGTELDELKGEALEQRILASRVFARVSPRHKGLIVEVLQRHGKTVAMTGDGVNDAPGIKRAEIGIAMGSGTDVTKSVSDMVIADDNFSTIVTAVAEGRRIFANIRKTVAFFLATNLGEVLAVLFATVFFPEYSFLSSTQLLWINLITDSFPVLAMGMEQSEPDSMRRPPKRAEKELMSKKFFLPIVFFGFMLALFIIAVYLYALKRYSPEVACTAALFTMSFAELMYAFCVRTERSSVLNRDFFSNRVLLVTVTVGIVVNLLLCVLPPVREAFGIVLLPKDVWAAVAVASLLVLPMGECYKWLLRKRSSVRQFRPVRSLG